jgi:capsule biosynthesis phosphatase
MSLNNQHSALVVDIDGTICNLRKLDEDYSAVEPNLKFISKLKVYHDLGYRIILFTSRNMNTYKGNLGLINKYTAPILIQWLNKWNVPFDELVFGKPWAYGKGFYIDDKAIRPDEFISMNQSQILNIISRYE